MSIEHKHGECTGDWLLITARGRRELVCETCGATYEATQRLRQAAVDENLAGVFLRRLANEGAAA